MAGVEREELEEPRERPLLAFGVALGVDLLALLASFLLLFVWPVVLLALVPYAGGRLAGRYVERRLAVRLGALAGAVMVTVLVALLLSLLGQFPGERLNPFEAVGLSLIIIAYLLAAGFGALGGRHGTDTGE